MAVNLSHRRMRRRAGLRAVLAVERLEGRCLLTYTVTDLGVLGGQFSAGYAINQAGQVAGLSDVPGTFGHAFLYDGAQMRDLAPGDPLASKAWAVNDQGWVAGGAAFAGSGYDAFLYDGQQLLDLGNLGGAGTVAYGMNNRGWVVGLAAFADRTHPFLYDGQTMTDLGNLVGGIGYSAAFAVNNRGQVVGGSTAATSDNHAFLWQDGVMTDLGALGGPAGRSAAYAINDRGQVAGTSGGHAVLWQGGQILDLGTLPGYSAQAQGINKHGQVVGYAQRYQGERLIETGFLYDRGRLVDLDDLLPRDLHLDRAYGINDRGQVVGLGHRFGSSSSTDHAWLLTPPRSRHGGAADQDAADPGLAVGHSPAAADAPALPVVSRAAAPGAPPPGPGPGGELTAGMTGPAATPPAGVPASGARRHAGAARAAGQSADPFALAAETP